LAVTELASTQTGDTIIDFPAVERFGVKVEGNAEAADAPCWRSWRFDRRG